MHLRGCLLLVCSWLFTAVSLAAPSLVFDTEPGDTWSLEPQLTGSIIGGTCERIIVQSPHAQVQALQLAGRFFATVPMIAGDNPIIARCMHGARVLAETKPQIWRARLPDAPKARVRIVPGTDKVSLDAGASEAARGIAAPLVRHEWSTHGEPPSALRLRRRSW